MSLICGALKWLVDSEKRDSEEVDRILHNQCSLPSKGGAVTSSRVGAGGSSEPDWMREFEEKHDAEVSALKLKRAVEEKLKRKDRVKKLKDQYGIKRGHWKKQKPSSSAEVVADLEEDGDLVLADYDSDSEDHVIKEESDCEEEEDHVKKVYYCSRTHSQLAQFVRQIQSSPYSHDVHVITMGSRQNLCINESVCRLKSIQLINERCIELQKGKGKVKAGPPELKKRQRTRKSDSCQFYTSPDLTNFTDLALEEVHDIEQLVTMGRELRACPYYGVRRAIPAAQLVVLPYQLLLHRSSREAIGVRLQGNVVLIDEAHNLADTITSIYSLGITGAQVQMGCSQLQQYIDRYKMRLSARNTMYLQQIQHLLNCFIKCLTVQKKSDSSTGDEDTRLMRLNDFLFECRLDNLNMFQLVRYCQRSQLCRKLNGFVERYTAQATVPGSGEDMEGTLHSTSPFIMIESFLAALTNHDDDCRVVITKRPGHLDQSSVKFLLLNPGVHFADVVRESRSVIMVGGTMQPTSDFRQQLLPGINIDRVVEFSCGHVISSDQLLVVSLARGPSGLSLDYTFQSRDSVAQVEELGRVVTNICSIVPEGVVCFFPSYEYEKMVHTAWEGAGVLDRIAKKKKVFREPRSSNQSEQVLAAYSSHCVKGKGGGITGAILLCVVGGKMSEGINFSDELGRCVVMVGLPYPNIKSPELAEKMQYLNSTMPKGADGRLPGQVHYENLCMKAVNQSIGRAIRHSKDYSSIVLLDQRYARQGVIAKLPQWMLKSHQKCDSFGVAFSSLRKFFVSMERTTNDDDHVQCNKSI